MLMHESHGDAVGADHQGGVTVDTTGDFRVGEVSQAGGVFEGGVAQGGGVVDDVDPWQVRQSGGGGMA